MEIIDIYSNLYLIKLRNTNLVSVTFVKKIQNKTNIKIMIKVEATKYLRT